MPSSDEQYKSWEFGSMPPSDDVCVLCGTTEERANGDCLECYVQERLKGSTPADAVRELLKDPVIALALGDFIETRSSAGRNSATRAKEVLSEIQALLKTLGSPDSE